MKKFFTLITAIIVSTAMAFASDTYIITGDYNNWSLTDNCITFTEKDNGSFEAIVDAFTTGQWGFKIIKNPSTSSWTYAYGSDNPISTNTYYTLEVRNSGDGGSIYLGHVNNNVTLHNAKFVFSPSSDETLSNFCITADETITTGINQFDADKVNNAKTTIYNISGQKLTEPQSGINIVNGKKFIRK